MPDLSPDLLVDMAADSALGLRERATIVARLVADSEALRATDPAAAAELRALSDKLRGFFRGHDAGLHLVDRQRRQSDLAEVLSHAANSNSSLTRLEGLVTDALAALTEAHGREMAALQSRQTVTPLTVFRDWLTSLGGKAFVVGLVVVAVLWTIGATASWMGESGVRLSIYPTVALDFGRGVHDRVQNEAESTEPPADFNDAVDPWEWDSEVEPAPMAPQPEPTPEG